MQTKNFNQAVRWGKKGTVANYSSFDETYFQLFASLYSAILSTGTLK